MKTLTLLSLIHFTIQILNLYTTLLQFIYLVDGGWGRWSDWTDCSVTCGVGFRSRERKCNSPVPQNGGKPCNDSGRLETIDCIKPSCKGLWKWKCLRAFLKTKVLKTILVWYKMLVTLSFYKRRAENLGIALLTQSFHDPHIEFIYHVITIYLSSGRRMG